MADQVGIWNRALQKLGASRVSSITETSRNALSCLGVYAARLDALLEEHDWSFSIQRVQLAADATDPTFTKSNRFTLPGDFLRLCNRDPEDNLATRDWQIEGGYIYTNDSAPLNVRYVSGELGRNPNRMTPLFREALSTDMAFEMSEEITQSNTKKASLLDDKKASLAAAKRANGNQRPALQPPPDTFISCRE